MSGGVTTFYSMTGFSLSCEAYNFDLHIKVKQVNSSVIQTTVYSISTVSSLVHSVGFVSVSFNKEGANRAEYG